MESMNSFLDDSTMDEEGNKVFKSKNLVAERKRRQKLSDRLLALRALVPIITNMNKATIITDAITYIQELQKQVKDLGEQLGEMESTFEEELRAQAQSHEIDTGNGMEKWIIEPEVEVTRLHGKKVWIKIVYEKKRGAFTKLMEALNVLGFDIGDTSVTTSKGALLVTSCLEGIEGGMLAAEHLREVLLEIIIGI